MWLDKINQMIQSIDRDCKNFVDVKEGRLRTTLVRDDRANKICHPLQMNIVNTVNKMVRAKD